MESVKTKGVKLFRMMYCQQNILPHIATRYMVRDAYHVLKPELTYLYSRRERGILWWSASQAQMTKEKRVVRSWSLRRVRLAFKQALKKHGYDEDGRKLQLDSNGEVINRLPGLKGTLSIVLHTPVMLAKFEQVQREALLAVQELKQFTPKKDRQSTRQPLKPQKVKPRRERPTMFPPQQKKNG